MGETVRWDESLFFFRSGSLLVCSGLGFSRFVFAGSWFFGFLLTMPVMILGMTLSSPPAPHMLPARPHAPNAAFCPHLLLYDRSLPNIEHRHPLLLTSVPAIPNASSSNPPPTHLSYALTHHTTPHPSSSLVLQSHNRNRMSYTALALTTTPIIESFTSSFRAPLRPSPRQSVLSTLSFSIFIFPRHLHRTLVFYPLSPIPPRHLVPPIGHSISISHTTLLSLAPSGSLPLLLSCRKYSEILEVLHLDLSLLSFLSLNSHLVVLVLS